MQAKQIIIAGALMGAIMFALPQANAETRFVLRVDPLALLVGNHRHHHGDSDRYRRAKRTPKFVYNEYKYPRRFKRVRNNRHCDRRKPRFYRRNSRNW